MEKPLAQHNMNQNQTQTTTTTTTTTLARFPFTEPIRCIVKLGGAAITCKNELEKINEEILQKVSEQLREAMVTSTEKPPGMDWSKRPGTSEICCNPDEFGDHSVIDCSRFIVVHGAGSFGHFQASKSGVHKGPLSKPIVKGGFIATRISEMRISLDCCENEIDRCNLEGGISVPNSQSLDCTYQVTTLNLEIVRALAREGISSVAFSPFSCGWFTKEKHISSGDLSSVAMAIDSGFTPVLHGDAVFDEIQGCSILSGDVIISHLAAYSKPKYVVFLTDVYGVYDCPPTEPDAILLKEIAVGEDGSWSVVNPKLQNSIELTVAAHDTTGGMKTKISEAAMIAKLGIDVYIVKAATSHSLRALNGDLSSSIPDDWLGTVVRSSR